MKNLVALLINPPYPRRLGGGVVPPIGLSSLAASLRVVGAEPVILDLAADFPDYKLDGSEESLQRVATFLQGEKPPLIIGIGPLVTANLRPTYEIIKLCRSLVPSRIIVGGPLCSVPDFSTIAAPYLGVDLFVAGDGETPLVTIWNNLSSNLDFSTRDLGVGIPNNPQPKSYREKDLNKLPIPARDLLTKYIYKASSRRTFNASKITSAFLSRGCPYSCTFCAAPLASGNKLRGLSKERIVAEIEACSQGGFQNIIFYDDCLFVKSSKLEEKVLEFCECMDKANWQGFFQLELRCDAVVSLSDQALLSLAQAGCRQINMGIEKAHYANLKKLRKQLTPEIAWEACEKVNEVGIRSAGTFILGGPNETKDEIDATIEFALTLPLDLAQFNPLALYPGTTLFAQEFNDQKFGSWLDLCLDRQLAPLGDILWQSSEIPLEYILKSISRGYSLFFSDDRMKQVLKKSKGSEKNYIMESYRLLQQQRAQSWFADNNINNPFSVSV